MQVTFKSFIDLGLYYATKHARAVFAVKVNGASAIAYLVTGPRRNPKVIKRLIEEKAMQPVLDIKFSKTPLVDPNFYLIV